MPASAEPARAPAAGGSARSRSPSSRCRRVAERGSGAARWPKAIAGSASTGCRGPRRCGNGATASCSCARAEGDEWPDLSDAALGADRREWLAPVLAGKNCARRAFGRRIRRRRCTRASPGRCSAGSTPRRRPISKRRPARACRSTTRPRAVRRSRSACRSCSASTAIRRSPAAEWRLLIELVVAGAPAGADHPRPARLLARQLCRRARRDARALSETSLAGGSASRRRRRGEPKGEAANSGSGAIKRGTPDLLFAIAYSLLY